MAASVAEAATDPVRVLVVGQGYVGLPLALRAVEVGDIVTAYDIDAGKVEQLRGGRSHVSDVADVEVERALASGRYRPVADAAGLGEFDVAVITVPTPLAEGVPDLGADQERGGTRRPAACGRGASSCWSRRPTRAPPTSCSRRRSKRRPGLKAGRRLPRRLLARAHRPGQHRVDAGSHPEGRRRPDARRAWRRSKRSTDGSSSGPCRSARRGWRS